MRGDWIPIESSLRTVTDHLAGAWAAPQRRVLGPSHVEPTLVGKYSLDQQASTVGRAAAILIVDFHLINPDACEDSERVLCVPTDRLKMWISFLCMDAHVEFQLSWVRRGLVVLVDRTLSDHQTHQLTSKWPP